MKVSYSSNVLTLTQNQNRPQSASKWSPCAQIPFPEIHRVAASRWIEPRKLSSDRLTNVYLERIARFDPNDASAHHRHERIS
jgi:hypothetical protein